MHAITKYKDTVLQLLLALCLFLLFVSVMGWFTAVASVALSGKSDRPGVLSVLTFPLFSFILSASILFTLIFPVRRWKPIPHGVG
jgi:hypothetical protein